MVIRGLVYVFAVIAILVGISLLIFPFWWVDTALILVNSSWYYLIAATTAIFGGVLLIAAIRRLVGLRIFVGILGAIILIVSLIYLANLDIAQNMVNALLLQRPRSYQLVIMLFGGIIRIGIGIALLYALAKTPTRRTTQA